MVCTYVKIPRLLNSEGVKQEAHHPIFASLSIGVVHQPAWCGRRFYHLVHSMSDTLLQRLETFCHTITLSAG